MGIFDIFTGEPAREAAQQSRAVFAEQHGNNIGALDAAFGNSQGYIRDGNTAARGNITGGYGTARGDITTGGQNAIGYINDGTQAGLGYLDQARDAYTPLSDLAAKYGQSTSLYQDALGVNGADAAGAARGSFETSLPYTFNLDQGLEAINRRRNAGGMLASGNADRDAQEYGAGLASRESGAWLDRLAGFINPELAATQGAATGVAGVAGQQANLVNTAGINSANIAGQTGRSLADLAAGQGRELAGINTGEGTTLANLATQNARDKVTANNAFASPYANTFDQEAQAEMQGSGNLWNFGMNLARLGTSAFGGMGGGGSQMVNGYNVAQTGGGNPFPMPI
jgi:hypothetical protein